MANLDIRDARVEVLALEELLFFSSELLGLVPNSAPVIRPAAMLFLKELVLRKRHWYDTCPSRTANETNLM